MKRLLLLIIVIAFIVGLPASHLLMAGPQKVDICHVPPGNPANAHVISVSEKAVPAHLAHGDNFDLGNCGVIVG